MTKTTDKIKNAKYKLAKKAVIGATALSAFGGVSCSNQSQSDGAGIKATVQIADSKDSMGLFMTVSDKTMDLDWEDAIDIISKDCKKIVSGKEARKEVAELIHKNVFEMTAGKENKSYTEAETYDALKNMEKDRSEIKTEDGRYELTIASQTEQRGKRTFHSWNSFISKKLFGHDYYDVLKHDPVNIPIYNGGTRRVYDGSNRMGK